MEYECLNNYGNLRRTNGARESRDRLSCTFMLQSPLLLPPSLRKFGRWTAHEVGWLNTDPFGSRLQAKVTMSQPRAHSQLDPSYTRLAGTVHYPRKLLLFSDFFSLLYFEY